VFGRKIEVSEVSTIGGARLEREARGMPYGPLSGPAEPFIRGDPNVTTEPFGVMTSRCIEGGGPTLAAWQSQADTPARERSWRRSTLDERLERPWCPHKRPAAAANPRVRPAALIVCSTRTAAPN
jgi:hypothetical protein